jgi:hypothetical protein
MKMSGKEVWHKVRTFGFGGPGADRQGPVRGMVTVAREVAFMPTQDGRIRAGERWTRDEGTAMEWRRATLRPELRTVEAYRARLTAQGYVQGAAPAGVKAPSLHTVVRQEWEGRTETVCEHACTVEPDGMCQHGAPTWLRVYGLL